MTVASVEELSDSIGLKKIRLKPNSEKKKVIHSCDVFKFACNLDSKLHIISFTTKLKPRQRVINIEKQAV